MIRPVEDAPEVEVAHGALASRRRRHDGTEISKPEKKDMFEYVRIQIGPGQYWERVPMQFVREETYTQKKNGNEDYANAKARQYYLGERTVVMESKV